MSNLIAWCDAYGWVTLILGTIFLLGALAAALVETLALIRAKRDAAEKAPEIVRSSAKADGVDPVELLEALKGVLEAIKGLPAWIAVFLAGLALLWLASEQPEACACNASTENCAGAEEADDASERPDKANGSGGAPNSPTSNVQTPPRTNKS